MCLNFHSFPDTKGILLPRDEFTQTNHEAVVIAFIPNPGRYISRTTTCEFLSFSASIVRKNKGLKD